MKLIKLFVFVFYIVLFPLYSYEYDLCVCAIFRDEARFLKEWIEFHKLVGVQHFYLYNNLSTDHYLSVLHSYIKAGEVDLIELDQEHSNQIEFNAIQMSAYDHALQLARGKARWVAFIDTDEFLFPMEKNDLVAFLKDYEEYGGLEVNWQTFGTSAVKTIPKDKLLIEFLTWRGNRDLNINHNTKSIVHPHLVTRCTGAHNFAYQDSHYSVYSNYAHSSQYPLSPYILTDKIRINHYWARDEDFLYKVKVPRYQKWQQHLEFVNHLIPLLNEVEDQEILRFASDLKKSLKRNRKLLIRF